MRKFQSLLKRKGPSPIAVPEPIDPARYVVDTTVDDTMKRIYEAQNKTPPPRKWDELVIMDLDGVSWGKAPIPPVRHACWVQTRGVEGLRVTERCACGGLRMDPYLREDDWMDRNSRKPVA